MIILQIFFCYYYYLFYLVIEIQEYPGFLLKRGDYILKILYDCTLL